MRLSDEAIDELREIYHDEFHEDLSRDQAVEIGSRLLDLVRLLSRPLPQGGDLKKPLDFDRLE